MVEQSARVTTPTSAPSTAQRARDVARLRLIRIDAKNVARWQPQLAALALHTAQPLGDDAVTTHLGDDPLAFFARLGDVACYALADGDVLVAVGCGVLRPRAGPSVPRRWQLGGLQVHPHWRGLHLPVHLLGRAFFQNYARCGRGFGVAMNPPDGKTPPAVRALAHYRFLPPAVLGSFQLELFSLDTGSIANLWTTLEEHLGAVHLVSMAGLKDLVLQSTGQPLPLLHVRCGPPTDKPDRIAFNGPRSGHLHMVCAPHGSPLAQALRAKGHAPSATATVVHHRLGQMDWRALDTSEI